MASEVERVRDAARRQGWVISRQGNGHWRCTPPDKSRAIVICSDSEDHRALRNSIAQFRASGLVWPELRARDPRGEPDEAEEDAGPSTSTRLASHVDPLEAAFLLLKSAREDMTAAAELQDEAERAFKAAQASLQSARETVARASDTMRARKLAFDRLFGGEAAA